MKISCHSSLDCQVSVDRSATTLMCLPFYVKACLSLAAFRILSLSLYFSSFTMICHAEDQLKLCLKGVLCASWINVCFLPQIGDVLSYDLFKYTFGLFLSLFFFWNFYDTDIIFYGVSSLILPLMS